MKPIQLYIPVTCVKPVTKVKSGGFNQRMTTTQNVRRTTYIGVHNTVVIKGLLPTTKDIMGHLAAERQREPLGFPFTSIKISTTPDMYHKCSAELGCKMGGRYGAPVIDIVMNSGGVPIIQIRGDKVVKPVIPKMVRTIMPPKMIRTK
jgi:hypothetical protein